MRLLEGSKSLSKSLICSLVSGVCQEQVSDSTKWQIGRSGTENNGQGDHQGKALVKGCHERTRARRCVSSQEKVHTNKNLARAMAKSRAGHRQLRQMCQSGQERIQEFYRGLQHQRPREMSGIEVQRFQNT